MFPNWRESVTLLRIWPETESVILAEMATQLARHAGRRDREVDRQEGDPDEQHGQTREKQPRADVPLVLAGRVGIATAANHPPAVPQVLTGEFETQPAIRPGDQRQRHEAQGLG